MSIFLREVACTRGPRMGAHPQPDAHPLPMTAAKASLVDRRKRQHLLSLAILRAVRKTGLADTRHYPDVLLLGKFEPSQSLSPRRQANAEAPCEGAVLQHCGCLGITPWWQGLYRTTTLVICNYV